MILVIGGSSYIGGKLCEYFSKKGELIGGTYCNSPKKNLIHFNMENPNVKELKINLNKVDYAFICSAISNIDSCKKYEEKAYKINVEGTKKTLEQFFDLKITPIFLSSDQVFNGERGGYNEHNLPNPCNVYGEHKKTIESFLLESKEKFLIGRISKIFGLTSEDGTILTSWVKSLKNNETIHCATNQIISPTYVADLVMAFDTAIKKKLNGLYNIAAPESFSRYELAKLLKERLHIKNGKIVPCSIRDFNFLDSRPLNTSLDVSKFIQETGFKFSKMTDSIDILRDDERTNIKNLIY